MAVNAVFQGQPLRTDAINMLDECLKVTRAPELVDRAVMDDVRVGDGNG